MNWLEQLRVLHDEHFADDWDRHLDGLNAQLHLSGPEEFGLPTKLPPSWFVGNVDALVPGEWALVLSLNQARREEDDEWHLSQHYSPQSYWDHWRLLNRNYWEPRFYRPLVRLASAALNVTVARDDESDFATDRMLFLELVPYPSRAFSLSDETLQSLAERDIGMRLATEVRRLLTDRAQPGIILVNGAPAVGAMKTLDRTRVDLRREEYRSVHGPSKRLWHEAGGYATDGRRIPVVGFPFLRKPATHNAYVEIDQLGAAARALIEG